ncbi:MAG TPA: Stp1/IreP family PP2C-type Ser/Thr phosphatase [Candidatus Limnocylindrales bacterium]|nr:Stp1/IreP family PP2C-type Ser/Thr phosphatase [Candidatus Limnocylindrales bacterium]
MKIGITKNQVTGNGISIKWLNPGGKVKKEFVYGATDRGRKRRNNEDCYLLLPERDIFFVADGMGGHNAGEIASSHAIRIAAEYFTLKRISEMKRNREKIKETMIQAIQITHQGILEIILANQEYLGMGSTLVIAFVHGQTLYTCHVGDSRVYVINTSYITQITQDHSHVANLVRLGRMSKEEARMSPLKNRITQAVGIPFGLDPEYHEYPLNPEDRILLCTDGLWDMLSDEEIQAIVLEKKSPQEICKTLIRKANEAGGNDNITVVLITQVKSRK